MMHRNQFYRHTITLYLSLKLLGALPADPHPGSAPGPPGGLPSPDPLLSRYTPATTF